METIKKLQLNGVEYEFAGGGEFEALTDEEIDAICIPTTDTETKSIGEGLIVDEDGKLRLDPNYNFDHRYYTETETDERVAAMDYCDTSIIEYIRPYYNSKIRNSGTFLASAECTDSPTPGKPWFVKWSVVSGGSTVLIEATPYYELGNTYQKQYSYGDANDVFGWCVSGAVKYADFSDITTQSGIAIFSWDSYKYHDEVNLNVRFGQLTASGEEQLVATLGEGFRPSKKLYFPASGNVEGVHFAIINPDGTIYVRTASPQLFLFAKYRVA